MRVGLPFEDAVAVELELAEAGGEVLDRRELRVIDPNLVGEQVEQEPDEEVADQQETDGVVRFDGGLEGDQVDQADIANLDAARDQDDETQGVDPVPDANRQRVYIERLHFSVSCELGVSVRATAAVSLLGRYFFASHFKVRWPMGTATPEARARTSSRSSSLIRVPPMA